MKEILKNIGLVVLGCIAIAGMGLAVVGGVMMLDGIRQAAKTINAQGSK